MCGTEANSAVRRRIRIGTWQQLGMPQRSGRLHFGTDFGPTLFYEGDISARLLDRDLSSGQW